jgi:hypothetical protein
LPEDAAVWREERAKRDQWTIQDELMAVIAERVDYWGQFNARMKGAKSQHLPEPLRFPRPGQQPERKHVSTDAREIAAWFTNNK